MTREIKIKQLKKSFSRMTLLKNEVVELQNNGEVPDEVASNVISAIESSLVNLNNDILKIKNRIYEEFKSHWEEVECDSVDNSEMAFIHRLNPNLKIITSDYITCNLFIGDRGSNYTFALQNCDIKYIEDKFSHMDLNSHKCGYVTKILFDNIICYKKDDHIIIPFIGADWLLKYYSLYGSLVHHDYLPDREGK